MKSALVLFVALLGGVGTAADAGGIDCANPAMRLEKTICADREMLDYDRRIAAAYEGALAKWDGAIASYVRLDQSQWLTGFQSMERLEAAVEENCVLTDRACIVAELRRRTDDLESAAYVHSGVYRMANGMKLLIHPERGEGYRIRLFDPAATSTTNFATLDRDGAAVWEGTQSMLSAMGDADGGSLAAEDGCTLRLQPESLAVHVVQTGSCEGHAFGGTYARLLDETLRSYELELY